MIHFPASDCHNIHTLKPGLSEAVSGLRGEMEEDEVEALVIGNPQAVIEDRAIPFQPDALNPEEKRKSLRVKLPGFLSSKR
jgi:tyrosine-protein phosphatase YwqE